MKTLTVRSLTPDEQPNAIDVLVLAFASDPMTRWTWPTADRYLRGMPGLSRGFGGRAFARGTAYCADEGAGVALWLPPGLSPDEEVMNEALASTADPANMATAGGLFEQMAQFHPKEPHWYLPLIGVDPARQGQGCGDALMAHALRECDNDHLPAYLESTNPRNITLYQRHGFEALGTIQAGTSPALVPMLRRPR